MFANPAAGAWPCPLMAKSHLSTAAMMETALDTSSAAAGRTMHPGLSAASCRDQYELSVTL
jgi:hypothetical protein